jgi:hypothetical protein
MNGRARAVFGRPVIGRLSLTLLALMLAACASQRGPASAADPAETICVEPRPQVCTMDYRPVCARLESGEMRTYSNACGACADAGVIAHLPGACE